MKSRKLMVTVIWLGAGACLSAQDRLTVAVFDYTGVPDAVMSPAVEMARNTFRVAGIETVWLVCPFSRAKPEGCTLPLPPLGLYVTMNVVPKVPAEQAGHAGFALTGPDALQRPRAYAAYTVVEDLAKKMRRPAWLVLGCVMTHEIAHVLGLKHGEWGVMRATLSPRDLDDVRQGWAFTAAEDTQLRAGTSRLVGAREVAEAGRR